MATFTIGAFGMIFDDEGRVLLCLRNDFDIWNLPGGCMDNGETPEECVIREIKEETTLDAEVVRLAGVYAKPEKDDIVFSFVCKIVGGKPQPTDESKEIRFFAIDEIPPNTSPKQVIRIHDAFKYPQQTLLITQKGPSSRELHKQGKL